MRCTVPAKSQAQRAYLYSHFGPAWVVRHHFDTKGELPYKVGKKSRAKAKKKGRRKRG